MSDSTPQTRRYVWDFAGPRAEAIARHHAAHLEQFVARQGLEGCEVGTRSLSEVRWQAWLTAPQVHHAAVEKALRPPRFEDP